MKKAQHTPHMLLIRPPYSVPGDISEHWTAFKTVVEGIPFNVRIDDAATDFFVRILAGGEHLSSDRRLFEEAGRRYLLGEHRPCQEVLRDLVAVTDALASASGAFAPCRFHRYGFAHEGLSGVKAVIQFAEDRATNPFRHYADHLWQPFDDSAPPDSALLCIDRPGQMGPAVTMARSWATRWPRIPLKLFWPEHLMEGLNRDLIVKTADQWPFDVMTTVSQLHAAIAETASFDGAIDWEENVPSPRFRFNDGVPLLAAQMPEIVREAQDSGARLIVWRECGDEADAVTRQLYAASRKDIWNHVILNEESPDALRQFAAANANIVHSYCHVEKPASLFSDADYTFPSTVPDYGRTRSMPGTPLWMLLKDPGLIARRLVHDHAKTLMRMRVRQDTQRLFEVGKQLCYYFKSPDDLPAGHLEEIVRMVGAGGSVNTQFVRHNLERAYLIAYVEEEGVIVGNSSLKQPREEYIDAVSQQSGIDLHDYLERGYTSVRPEYRGLGVGAKLLEGLTERAGDQKIFSVIAENNVATQKMAMRNRTRRVATFFSQRAKKEMSVWIPEWMLPEGVDLPAQPALEIGPNSQKDGS